MARRSCSICQRPDALQITKSITAGGSKREVSDRYGLSPSSVHRHKLNCLSLAGTLGKAGKPPSSPAASSLRKPDRTAVEVEVLPPETDSEDLLRKADRLLNDVQDVITRSKASGNDRMVLLASRELRAAIELLVAAHAKFGDNTGIGRLLRAMNDRDEDEPKRRRVEFVIADEPEGWKPVRPSNASSVDDNSLAPEVPESASDNRALTPALPDRADAPPKTDTPRPEQSFHDEPSSEHGGYGLPGPIGYSGSGAGDALRSLYGNRR